MKPLVLLATLTVVAKQLGGSILSLCCGLALFGLPQLFILSLIVETRQ